MVDGITGGVDPINNDRLESQDTDKIENVQQERVETLSNQDEIKEKPEALPEVRETAESVEKATLKPEEKVEIERSIEESENLESAFSAAMESPPDTPPSDTVGQAVGESDRSRDPEEGSSVSNVASKDGSRDSSGDPVEQGETVGSETEDQVDAAPAANEDGGRATGERTADQEQVSATPITLPKEDPDGVPDPASEVSATPITLPKEDPDGIPEGASEGSATPIPLPGEESNPADEISATPIPLPGEESNPAEQVSATPITLPKEDPDGISEPQQVEVAAPSPGDGRETAASTAPELDLDGKGEGEPSVEIVGPDGEPVGSTFDDGQGGMEQPGDIRQPSKDGGMADPLGDANRTEAEGQMGVVDTEGIDPIEGASVPDSLSSKASSSILDDVKSPDSGQNQESELGELQDATEFGADPSVSYPEITASSGDASGTQGGVASGKNIDKNKQQKG